MNRRAPRQVEQVRDDRRCDRIDPVGRDARYVGECVDRGRGEHRLVLCRVRELPRLFDLGEDKSYDWCEGRVWIR